MTTIYIVTSGDYSDYHIDGVFTNKELAWHYVDNMNDPSRFTVEEHPADPITFDHVKHEARGRAYVRVLNDNGRVSHPHLVKGDGIVHSDNCHNGYYDCLALRNPTNDKCVIKEQTGYGVWAYTCDVTSFISQEHAHKVCVETFQKWRATQKGVV